MKRVLSLVLALVMVLGMIPTFAAEMTGGEHLLEHGFITGKPGDDVATKLDAGAALTRQELAALIAELMGEKEIAAVFAQPADYADADKIGAWAVPYVAYAQVNGWMSGKPGNMFDPTGPVPGQQLAAVLMNALGYTVDTEAKYATVIADAAALGLAVPSGNLTRGAAFEAMWTAVSEVKVNGEEVTLGEKLGKLDPPTPPVAPAELVVKGVSVLNPKQIQVTFGDTVDPDTVLDADGVIINGTVKIDSLTTGFTGEFDADEKVLTLTKDVGNWTKDTIYVVSLEGIKNAEAKVVPAYAVALKMVDTTIPSIVSVKSVTNALVTRNVTVTFSEPVSFTSIKVNGKFVSATTADSGFGAAYTLTATEDLDAGSTYTIEINNLRDLFNNAADALVTASVTIVRDNVKPLIVSVTPVNETRISVKFNKTMASTVNVDSFVVTKVDAAGNTVILTQSALATRSSVNRDTFNITLASAPFDTSTQTSKDIKVTVKGLQDSVGNTMDSANSTITVTRDTVKPVITSVVQKPGTQNKLVVTFSERVTLADGNAVNATAFAIRNSDGSATANPNVTITGVSAITSSNTVEITLSEAFGASGAYSLVLIQNSIKDTASVANFNAAQVVTFNFTKDPSVVAQLTAVINTTQAGGLAVNSTTNKKVEIDFDASLVNGINFATGAYKVGAADDAANYTVDGIALPVGTVVSIGAGDVVTLDFSAVATNRLPSAFINGGTLSVGVSNVKSVAGSTVQYTTAAVIVVDTTKPTMSAAYLTGSQVDGYTFTVQLSEGMSATQADNFVITVDPDGNPVVVAIDTAVVASNNTQITLRVTTGAEKDKIKAGLDAGHIINLATSGNPAQTLDRADVANALTANVTGITVVKYTTN